MPIPPSYRRPRVARSPSAVAEPRGEAPGKGTATAAAPESPFAASARAHAAKLDVAALRRRNDQSRRAQPVPTRRNGHGGGGMLLPNSERYASQYTAGHNVYWGRFDEALRDNWQNALALHRSEFVQELIYQRQWPVAALGWHVEADDPNDEDQKRGVELMTKLIQAVPMFNQLQLYLLEDEWFGKYGSQLVWDKTAIDGRMRGTVVDHEPINGDSIVYKHDKTPGILLRAAWSPSHHGDGRWVETPNPSWVQPADRGRALFLYDRYWRDHFLISNFEPYGADFLHEGDKAAGIFGYGIRGRFYWALQNRDELRSWLYEALQRIGANGMLYGFFESGNVENMDAVIEALMMLMRDNISAFPVEKGQAPNELKHIEPSGVQYEIMFKEIERIEECLRRAIVGQDLSAVAHATGIGSGSMEFQQSTFDKIIRIDANRQSEVFTRDLLDPLVRFNQWPWRGQVLDGHVPYRMRFAYNLDKANAVERSQVITSALGWGMELSKEAAYKDCGLSPPKDPSDVLKQAQPPGLGGPGDPDGQPRTVLDALRRRKGLPPLGGDGASAGDGAPAPDGKKTFVMPGMDGNGNGKANGKAA